jgi:hypothetical protein
MYPGLSMPKMGPYGSPQFMGWVATQRRESVLSLEKKVLQTTVEQMKVEFSTEAWQGDGQSGNAH